MGVTLRQFRKTRGKKVPELSAPLVRLFRPAGRRESGRGRTLIRITVGSSQTNSERASEARYVAGLSLYCAVAGGDFPREFPRRVCVCVYVHRLRGGAAGAIDKKRDGRRNQFDFISPSFGGKSRRRCAGKREREERAVYCRFLIDGSTQVGRTHSPEAMEGHFNADRPSSQISCIVRSRPAPVS